MVVARPVGVAQVLVVLHDGPEAVLGGHPRRVCLQQRAGLQVGVDAAIGGAIAYDLGDVVRCNVRVRYPRGEDDWVRCAAALAVLHAHPYLHAEDAEDGKDEGEEEENFGEGRNGIHQGSH